MGLLDLHMYLSGAALTKCQHTLLCHSIWIDDSQNPKTCGFLILGMRTSLNNAYVQFRCTDIKLDVHSLRPVAKCGHTGNYVRMTLLCTLRWFKLHCIVLDHNTPLPSFPFYHTPGPVSTVQSTCLFIFLLVSYK